MDQPAKIGILDSGVGGLSVLREIRALLPGHPLDYYADSAWCPYGTKPPGAIQKRVFSIVDGLLAREASVIVLACNSATIHAVEQLRAVYPVPFVGMEPGVKPAVQQTRTGIIAVLATEASIAGERFHRLVNAHAQGVRVITRPCPQFVELVEAGVLEGAEVEEAVDEVVGPLLDQRADVFVLGCTHYPFLRAALERRLPSGTSVIDTGAAVARRVAQLVRADGGAGLGAAGPAPIELRTSGDLAVLRQLAGLLLPDLERLNVVA